MIKRSRRCFGVAGEDSTGIPEAVVRCQLGNTVYFLRRLAHTQSLMGKGAYSKCEYHGCC